MRNPMNIDQRHSREIVREIGEQLRSVIKAEPEVPTDLRSLMERLRRSEE